MKIFILAVFLFLSGCNSPTFMIEQEDLNKLLKLWCKMGYTKGSVDTGSKLSDKEITEKAEIWCKQIYIKR